LFFGDHMVSRFSISMSWRESGLVAMGFSGWIGDALLQGLGKAAKTKIFSRAVTETLPVPVMIW
jgi:hypothetical protein